MKGIEQIGRVMVPVADQDAAIAFWTDRLGFSVVADVAFGEGSRWVEVAPPGGGTTLSLVPPQGQFTPGRMTGIGFTCADPCATRADLAALGIDVDADMMGGDGTVPPLFFFRDPDGNHFLVAQGS